MGEIRLKTLDGISQCLQEIWNKTKANQSLREGEKLAIQKNLREIQYMWRFFGQ